MAESSRAVREDFVFSHGAGHQDIDPQETITSFAVFVTLVENPKRLRHGKLGLKDYLAAPRKVQMAEKNGPYFITGTFSRPGRKAEHLEKSYAFVADLDRGGFNRRRIEEVLDGYSFVAWTTYSHSENKPKWRVVIPYDRPVLARAHEDVFAFMQTLFEGAIDEASRRVAQLYYFPGCPRDATDLHEVVSDTGCSFFDPLGVEARSPLEAEPDRPTKGARVFDKTADIVSALEYVDIPKQDNSGRYKLWLDIGMALHHETHGSEQGLRIWRSWHVAQGYDRDESECEEKWPTFGKRGAHGAGITIATLFDRAIKNGWRKVGNVVEIAVDDVPVEFSENALALEFAERHRDGLRYVNAWKKWFKWDGCAWREERTLADVDLMRKMCQEKAALVRMRDDLTVAKRERIALTLSQAHTVMDILKLARGLRAFAATHDVWDQDPYLFNTPKGTIDLRTGVMKANDPNDMITKVSAVAPEGECPTFISFLKRAMDDDTDTILFLQRLFGYALTGVTDEHSLTFFFGTGGNGKSTCLNAIVDMMGSYALVTSSETFIESRQTRHPTEIASLRGARLVSATEIEPGKHWKEALLKSLTGGEMVSARFMHQDAFTFRPQMKLVISGNNKPGLRNVDEAIARRLHLVEWAVTIPREERDTRLPEKLRAELPGILAWAVRGALEWRTHGLQPPPRVVASTSEYLANEDRFALWWDECVTVDTTTKQVRKSVYDSYAEWCRGAREHPLRDHEFYARVRAMGFDTNRKHGGTYMIIGLTTRMVGLDMLKPAPLEVVKKQRGS